MRGTIRIRPTRNAVLATAFCLLAPSLQGAEKQTVRPTPESARKEASPTKRARVIADLLGVRIGDEESAALSKLEQLGKRTTSPRGDGGRRHNFALEETPFGYVIVIVNSEGKVRRMSTFARPGAALPFEAWGDTTVANGGTETSVVWDMLKEGPGRNYRLVAKGKDRKAEVIFFIGAPKRGMELSDTIELPSPSPSAKSKPKSR